MLPILAYEELWQKKLIKSRSVQNCALIYVWNMGKSLIYYLQNIFLQ